jgi:hypothetical protein
MNINFVNRNVNDNVPISDNNWSRLVTALLLQTIVFDWYIVLTILDTYLICIDTIICIRNELINEILALQESQLTKPN